MIDVVLAKRFIFNESLPIRCHLQTNFVGEKTCLDVDDTRIKITYPIMIILTGESVFFRNHNPLTSNRTDVVFL